MRPPTARDPRVTWDTRYPWRRQPCDDDAKWLAFQRYLYDRRRPRRAPIRPQDILAALSDHWDWRAEMWDRQNEDERERLEATAASRHRRLAVRAQALAESEVDALLRVAESTPDRAPGLLRPETALRYAVAGVALEREAMGQATDGRPEGVDLDTSALEPEEVTLLRRLLERCA